MPVATGRSLQPCPYNPFVKGRKNSAAADRKGPRGHRQILLAVALSALCAALLPAHASPLGEPSSPPQKAERLPEPVPHPAHGDELSLAHLRLRQADLAAATHHNRRRAPRAASLPGACPDASQAHAAVFVFPHQPRAGETVRVVALAWSRAPLGQLTAHQSGRALGLTARQRFHGPPHSYVARLVVPRTGRLDIRLTHHSTGRTTACTGLLVKPKQWAPRRTADFAEAWPVTRAWDRWLEALYSAWIGRLFYVPRGGQGSWFPLHQVTRDPSRNWLHNALGRAEDDDASKAKVILMPDCADTPYFLRAYFAWKHGLPFMYQRCTRGNALTGPLCPMVRNNLVTKYRKVWNPVRRFNAFVREWVGWAVHTGTTRTLASDNTADFYPVRLSGRSLRPGRIFVDPAGHVFVLSQQRPGSRRQLGVIFGIDGHPDRTVSRKRFSKGTFIFNARYKTGGFKAFRPLVYAGGKIRQLSNAEIAAHPEYGDFSDVQAKLASNQAFYDQVHKALNPYALRPRQLYRSKIHALHEAVLERVKAVAAGIGFMERNQWRAVQIPKGPAIFETTGAWERYSTPARDLRLLMAIQDVLDFPREVLGRRHLYRIPRGYSDARLQRELHRIRETQTAALEVSYVRSNRTVKILTLADIIARRQALRMAYNPNDCIEIRWGAPIYSDERSTCRRRALPYQRTRMRQYRVWFQLLRRPALRG